MIRKLGMFIFIVAVLGLVAIAIKSPKPSSTPAPVLPEPIEQPNVMNLSGEKTDTERAESPVPKIDPEIKEASEPNKVSANAPTVTKAAEAESAKVDATPLEATPAKVIAPEKVAAVVNDALSPVTAKAIGFLKSRVDDGKWLNPGVTALCLEAIVLSLGEIDLAGKDAWLKPSADYLASMAKADGSIHDGRIKVYTTAVAVRALVKTDAAAYADIIAKGQAYLKGVQKTDGGYSYDDTGEADLSNTQIALEALAASGLDKEDDVFKNALAFVSSLQNRSESNPASWAGNDGGFVYNSNTSGRMGAGSVEKADGTQGIKSYGSMTYAGVKSLIFADVAADDPRLVDALAWVKANYTVAEHPGMGQVGKYYYFTTMAKALDVAGVEAIVAKDGTKHDWKLDLATELGRLQKADGSWANPEKKHWENMPELATAYALLSLVNCSK